MPHFTELPIATDFPLAGATVADIDLRDLAVVVIVAVQKENGEVRRHPNGSTLLEPKDMNELVGRLASPAVAYMSLSATGNCRSTPSAARSGSPCL